MIFSDIKVWHIIQIISYKTLHHIMYIILYGTISKHMIQYHAIFYIFVSYDSMQYQIIFTNIISYNTMHEGCCFWIMMVQLILHSINIFFFKVEDNRMSSAIDIKFIATFLPCLTEIVSCILQNHFFCCL